MIAVIVRALPLKEKDVVIVTKNAILQALLTFCLINYIISKRGTPVNTTKSKPKCVFVVKRNGKPYRYMTRVIIKGQRFYLGCFKTKAEASKVYTDFMKYCEKYQTSSLL